MAAANPLKNDEKRFYSCQKFFSFSRNLKFLSSPLGHVAKQLDKTDKVNFKFYDVTGWLMNICNIHIAQISRNKGNQTLKSGQLIECNMRNIFLDK